MSTKANYLLVESRDSSLESQLSVEGGGRLRQEDCPKFKGNLSYSVRVSQNKTNKQKQRLEDWGCNLLGKDYCILTQQNKIKNRERERKGTNILQ